MTDPLLTKEEIDALRVFRAALEDECLQDAILFYVTIGQNNLFLVRAKTQAYKTAIKKILETDDEHLAEVGPAVCYIYCAVRDCGYITNTDIIPRTSAGLFNNVATKHWASFRDKVINYEEIRDVF